MPLIDRALLIKLVPHAAGTAAGGLVSALLLALVLAPAFVLFVAARALRHHGTVRELRWRPVVAGLAVVVLLSLAVEFSGEEPSHWYVRGVVLIAFIGLVLAVLAVPIAWLQGRRRGFPRPPPPRRGAKPVPDRSRHAVARFAAGAGLLASTGPAALLKHRVYPEPLAWSATDAIALGIVAAPFAWLLGRVGCERKVGSGTLAWAATIALGGWLSLAARPLLIRQTTAATQEVVSMIAELSSGAPVTTRPHDRWRFGESAPLVQGMSAYYRSIQSALAAIDELEPVLTDASFQDAASLAATEARLEALRSRLGALDRELEQSALALRATVERASISSLMRERILQGVTDGLEGRPRLRQSMAPLVAALERLVEFMKMKRGRYWYEGEDILFEADADADTFNRLVEQLESEKSRVMAVMEKGRLDQRKRAEEFGRWAEDPFRRPRPERRD